MSSKITPESEDELIRAIQRVVGVKADGKLGPVSLKAIYEAVAASKHQNTGGAASGNSVPTPPHSLTISKQGLDKLIEFETGGEAYYNKALKSPSWPGYSSGVTVGVGYDLGYNFPEDIERDWKGKVPDAVLFRLQDMSGVRGQPAKALAAQLRAEGIEIPFETAKAVFMERTLPKFAKLTKKTYPAVDSLPPDAQAALLSLVFNRGGRLDDTDSRREMVAIKKAVEAYDLAKIQQLLLDMRRLWDKSTGLYKRRASEADMVRNSRDTATKYGSDDLLLV